MNFVRFLYDLMVCLTVNYSSLPDVMKKRFSEESFVNARIFFSDIVNSNSDFNIKFKRYE